MSYRWEDGSVWQWTQVPQKATTASLVLAGWSHTLPKRRWLRSTGNTSVPEPSCSKGSRGPSEKMLSCTRSVPSLQSSLLAVIYNSSRGQNHNRRKTLWGWTQSWGKYKPRSFDPAKSCLLTPPAVLPLSPQVERATPPSPCRILLPGLQLGGLFVSCSFQQDPAARGDILPIASTIWAQLGTQIDHYVLFNLFQFLCCENT